MDRGKKEISLIRYAYPNGKGIGYESSEIWKPCKSQTRKMEAAITRFHRGTLSQKIQKRKAGCHQETAINGNDLITHKSRRRMGHLRSDLAIDKIYCFCYRSACLANRESNLTVHFITSSRVATCGRRYSKTVPSF